MSNGRSSAGELLHAPSAHARPRGRAAEELSRSEERFFKVFQASPVAIILRTLAEGRVIDVNARYDELGGFLTVLKLDLSSLGKEPTTASASFHQKVDSMAKTMVAAIGSVRRICSDLRPSVLDHIGLTAAIEWQVEEWQAKTGVRCAMSSVIDDESLDPGRATAAFR